MKIDVNHIEVFIKKYPDITIYLDLSDQTMANVFTLNGGNISFTRTLSEEHINTLVEKGLSKISICCSKEILNNLRKLFPETYEKNTFEDSLDIVNKKLKIFDKMNYYSKAKRQIYFMQDIVKENKINKSSIVIFHSGEKITIKSIETLLMTFGHEFKIQYNESETGFLLFISDPVKHIKMRIDILALLSQTGFPIHETDDPNEIQDIVLKNKPKMLINTNLKTEWESKNAFLKYYEIDPFIKMYNFDNSPAYKKNLHLSAILEIYNGLYEDDLDIMTNKPILNNLPGEIRNPLMDKITFLKNNFSYKLYIELKYHLFFLGKKYNVKTIMEILDKIAQVS